MVKKVNVAIIDYQAGNLHSCCKAFEHSLSSDAQLSGEVRIITHADQLKKSTHIVLPGQGAFGDCIKKLSTIDGMIDQLEELVLKKARPFFGICVGMQLLAEEGLEHGKQKGLGWIKGQVKSLSSSRGAPSRATSKTGLKIPHMGWNDLFLHDNARNHPVMKQVRTGDHAYFVHSYKFVPDQPDQILASTDYGGPVTAVIAQDTCIGSQFHPEKSQASGLQLVHNFLHWKP